jgi:hypothetical protein
MAPALAYASGLLFVVGGWGALVAAFSARSLVVLLVAVLGDTGLGLSAIGAQTQVNGLAPSERRGELTAAFLACIHGVVLVTSNGVGLLSKAMSSFAATVASVRISWKRSRSRAAMAQPVKG